MPLEPQGPTLRPWPGHTSAGWLPCEGRGPSGSRVGQGSNKAGSQTSYLTPDLYRASAEAVGPAPTWLSAPPGFPSAGGSLPRLCSRDFPSSRGCRLLGLSICYAECSPNYFLRFVMPYRLDLNPVFKVF